MSFKLEVVYSVHLIVAQYVHERRHVTLSVVIERSAFLPPATKLGQGNIFRSVCQEFCSQEGSATLHAGIHPLPTRDQKQAPPLPLRGDTPPPDQRQARPRSRHPIPQDQRQAPLRSRPPPRTRGRHPHSPPAQCMLGDTGNKRVVRILLECNLVTVNLILGPFTLNE